MEPASIMKMLWKSRLIKIMRLTVVICFIALSQVFAGAGYSQGTRISLEEKNATLRDILEKIEDRSEFYFMYNGKIIDVNQRVSVKADKVLVNELLNQILAGTGITYKIDNRQIALSVTASEPEQVWQGQQAKAVSGKVTDANGVPIPGVTVVFKSTTRGTVTDINGSYILSNVPSGATLVFSFVGMRSQEILIGGRTTVDVVMTEEVIGMKEVVVVGYGTQKKVNITGAVDQISSETLKSYSVANVARALQGQIPGLNIQFASGRPNTNPAYNIRGLTSIGAGGSALILIDGIEASPMYLNPNDIESVSVLKDAASAAIYGARGAFGVILITTKKSKAKKSELKYSGKYSINRRTTTRDVVTDAGLFAKLYMESFTNLYGGTRKPTDITDTGILFSQEYVDELLYRSQNPDHGRPEVDVDPATGRYVYYGNNTDWWDMIMAENMPSTEHNLTASGGDDEANYLISGRYFGQTGIYKINPDTYNTYSLRAKGSVKATDWLTVTGSFAFSSNYHKDPWGSDDDAWYQLMTRGATVPMGAVYNPDGTYTRMGARSIGLMESDNYGSYFYREYLTSVGFDASVVKDIFNIKGDFSYKNNYYNRKRRLIPVPYSEKPGVITTVGNSYLYRNQSFDDYYAYNLYGDFKYNLDKHAFAVTGGVNVEVSNFNSINVSRDNLMLSSFDVFNMTTGTSYGLSENGSGWRGAGLFGRVNYIFDDKYLFEINARYDGSSKFPKGKYFGFFPSVSLGWRITEENFMAGTRSWLDNLKPRFSYGSLGNSRISPYAYIPRITASKSSVILGTTRPVQLNTPSPFPDNFTWETSTTFDVGLDVNMFQNRLGLVFDYFRRTTSNMITVGATLPAVFGASSPLGNYAELYTRGFELSLSWNDQINIRNKPLKYSARFTLADDLGFITKYNNPQKNLIIDVDLRTAGYYTGMCVGELWGLTTLGLFADQADINSHVDQSFIQTNTGGQPAQPGDIKFKDINNDGKIDWGNRTVDDPGDLSIIGNTTPRYKFGLNLDGEYGKFSVSAFFQGVGKHEWYPPHHQNPFWGPYGFWGAEIPKHFLENSYRADNPDPNAYWPLWKGNTAWGNRQLQTQTRYMQNAAYIRLKELTLAYSLEKAAQKIGMKDIQVFFTGYNIWAYSPVFKISKDLDPEQLLDPNQVNTNTGGDNYPMLKSFTVGVNITL